MRRNIAVLSASPIDETALRFGEAGGHVAGQRPADDQEGEEKGPHPENLEPAWVSLYYPSPDQPDQEHAQRRDLKEGRDLLERRRMQQVLVAVVEADRLHHHDQQHHGPERGEGGCIAAEQCRPGQ